MTTCLSDINVIVGGANLAALSLGRFVFMPYQRSQVRHMQQELLCWILLRSSPVAPSVSDAQRALQVAKAGLPVQNGMTHVKVRSSMACWTRLNCHLPPVCSAAASSAFRLPSFSSSFCSSPL